jgi:hypothetical protein
MTDETKHENTAGHGGYERQDLQVSGILYFLLGLGIVTLLCIFALRGMFAVLDHREKALQPKVNPLVTNVPADTRHLTVDYKDYLKQNFPDPRLEIDERGQLNGIRFNEDKTLYSYGWVDEKAGTVRIPIERAMELIVQRGLPVRPQGATGETPATSAGKMGITRKGAKK